MKSLSNQILLIIVILAIMLVALSVGVAIGIQMANNLVYNTQGNKPAVLVHNFDDCVAAGNPIMESYPRQCRHGGELFVEVLDNNPVRVITCQPSSRDVDACIQIYDPVCGSVQVECITTPCDPIQETFSNSCEACRNNRVISYIKGECTNE